MDQRRGSWLSFPFARVALWGKPGTRSAAHVRDLGHSALIRREMGFCVRMAPIFPAAVSTFAPANVSTACRLGEMVRLGVVPPNSGGFIYGRIGEVRRLQGNGLLCTHGANFSCEGNWTSRCSVPR